MGRTVYYCAMSLDGFIAEADDTIAWLTGYDGAYAGAAEPMDGVYEAFLENIGALVMGSATYEFILGELAAGSDWMYPGRPAWILSSRDLPLPEGADVRIVNAAVPGLCDEMLASAGGRDLWVVGGGNVASQFADERLLDDVVVTVVPVVLGAGKPLFDRPFAVPPAPPLRLCGTRPFATGMVELRYEVVRGGSD